MSVWSGRNVTHECGGERRIFRNRSLPSSVWVMGDRCLYPVNHLTFPVITSTLKKYICKINFCFCLKTKMQTHAQTQMYMNRGGEREKQGRNFSCERYVYFMYKLKNC